MRDNEKLEEMFNLKSDGIDLVTVRVFRVQNGRQPSNTKNLTANLQILGSNQDGQEKKEKKKKRRWRINVRSSVKIGKFMQKLSLMRASETKGRNNCIINHSE